MKKLCSMTDFVLEQNKNIQWSDTDNLENIISYAEFLKHPLELWMFVAVGENGNVLGTPKAPHTFASENSDLYIEKWNKEKEQYKKAKERCLFKGFEIIERKCNNSSFLFVEYKGIYVFYKSTGLDYFVISNEFNTIEDLIKYNSELTPTAIKKLGL